MLCVLVSVSSLINGDDMNFYYSYNTGGVIGFHGHNHYVSKEAKNFENKSKTLKR